ncbi:MAG: F0F1 ATP synthase subunit gamma [Nannocystaceae bacterium]
MTTVRRLEARLRAWRSFRGLAHAARSLAAAQSLRWSARAVQAAEHLGRARALVAGWSPPTEATRTPVVLAVGTDLGLCGRLNRMVADALVVEVAAHASAEPLVIAVGQRLRVELGERLADAPILPAPSSIEAALALAGRLEQLLVEVAEPRSLDLRIVLAGGTTPSGAPEIVTWGGREVGRRSVDHGAESSTTGASSDGREVGREKIDRSADSSTTGASSDEREVSRERVDRGAASSTTGGASAGDAGAQDRRALGVQEERPSRVGRRPVAPPRRALLTPPERVWGPAAALLLHARLVHAFAAAAASEADARLQTMSRAVDTSDRRIDEHERLLRKDRQESITQEMLEVLGGRRRGVVDANVHGDRS